MTTSYLNAPIISPLFMHMSNPSKRTRSTESLERALKRSKPFDTKTEKNIYPVIKTVSISTKTPPSEYNQVNQLLHSVHVERFGDPETRESWWEQNDVKMQDLNDNYMSHNSILKQAFFERHMHK